jgi:tripartite-type tricarboxylate transporter receptor subunit TctC
MTIVPSRVVMRAQSLVAVVVVAAAGACQPALAQEFYRGKTLTLFAGQPPGGGIDSEMRLVAHYLGKFIPGEPNIVARNMPGAGGMVLGNHLYNVAKPDGLTLGAIYPALYFNQLIKKSEVKYDWAKFNWIGSTVTSNQLLYMRADTPYKSIEEVRKASTAPKCGATDISSAGYYIPKIIDETLGTKFEIVSGYPSGQDIDLAVERGELQCRAFTITAYFAREPFISWRKRNFTSVLIQTGNKRDGRIKDSPTIYELMDKYKTNDNGRRLAKVILAAGDFGRPIVAAPGVPAERMKILRDSFDKTIADPAFLAEAEKRRLEIDHTRWDEMESLAKDVMATPPEIVARMRKLLGE